MQTFKLSINVCRCNGLNTSFHMLSDFVNATGHLPHMIRRELKGLMMSANRHTDVVDIVLLQQINYITEQIKI